MVKYLINGILNEFENQDEANEYLATLSSEDTVELIQDPKTEEATVAEEKANKPLFFTDAAEGADVVSETPAQDTESISEDASSGSRYVKFKSGTVVFENDYLENYAGTGSYPLTFDEYAASYKTTPKTTPAGADTQGGDLETVRLAEFNDKEKPGRDIANENVWDKTFQGNGNTAVRAIETTLKDSDEYEISQGDGYYVAGGKGKVFETVVTHINPDTKKKTTFSLNTSGERGGNIIKPEGKGKEFADFIANTMNLQDATTLKFKADNFANSDFIKGLNDTAREAYDAVGTQESFFAPVKTESRSDSRAGLDTTERKLLIGAGTDEVIETVTYPFAEEIKIATDKILSQSANKEMTRAAAEKQAKADIYEQAVTDKRLDLIQMKREAFLSANSQFRDEFAAFDNIKSSKLVVDLQNNTLLLESLNADLNKISDYSDELESFTKNPTKPMVIDGIEWGSGGDIIGTWKGIPITQANYDQLNTIQSDFNAKFNIYNKLAKKNASIADKLPEQSAKGNANALIYSTVEKGLVNFGWGVSDVVTGAGYAVSTLTSGAQAVTVGMVSGLAGGPSISEIYDYNMSAVDKYSNMYTAAKNKSKGRYVRDTTLKEGFSSPKGFGKFLMQEITGQAPILLAMAATGGYGALAIGLSTGGQAGMEMALEDAMSGKEVDRWNQFLTMSGIGLANAIPSQLTTIPILGKARKSFFSKTKFGVQGAEQYALGVNEFIKKEYKDVVSDVLLENIGEVATNFAENAIYGNDLTENIGHVAVSSTGFSFVFSALPFFKGIRARQLASKADIEQLSSYADAVLKSENALKDHQSTMKGLDKELLINARKTEKILERAHRDAQKAAENKAKELLKKPLNGVTASGAASFARLQTDAAKLKREIALLMDAKGDNQSLIDQKIEEFALIKASQELYIGSGYRNEFALMQQTNPDTYRSYIVKGREKLERENPGKMYSTKDNAVVLEATRAYNIDQSRKRIEQNQKINPDLVVFETKEKAMDAIDVREDLSEATKERVINSIENGNAGASVVTEDGKTFPYVVLESEAANHKMYVQEHENGHGTVGLIFKEGKGAQLYELGTQIREWLKINNPSLSARMENAMAGYEQDKNYNDVAVAEEAFMEFLEMVKEKRIDLTSSKNVPLNGMMAQMIQDGVGTDVYDYNFRGVDDFAAFAVKLAKGIADGSIDVAKAKKVIEKIDVKDTPAKIAKAIASRKKNAVDVKESMSPKMRKLLDRKEATEDNPYLDPEERDNKLQGISQQINELKEAEAAQNKSIGGKAKPSGPMTLEEADAAYEDALDAWEDAPDNDALLEEVEKALKEVEAAKNRFDAGEEVTPEITPENKPTEKQVREKKERSKKKYSLTDEAKTKIEPLIEEAQAMNKEIAAKEQETDAAKIAKIEAKPESEMTRTDKAIAIKKIKDNPTRTTKPAKLQRVEAEIIDRLEKPIGKAVTFFTKLLYDKIPKEAAAVIGGRDAYKSAAEARIISMVIKEFKKNTINRKGEETINDVEDLIFNRGGLRLLTLATDLGVANASEGISQQFDNVSNNIGTEDTMFDEGGIQMSVEGKFKISSLLASGGRYKQAMNAAVEFWKTNKGNSPIENFKKLPGFTAEVLAEMFDIPAGIFDKRIDRSPNLNKENYRKAMEAITKPYAVFKLTKDGITIEERREIDTAEAFTKEMQSKGFEVERVANQNMLQTLFKFLPQLSAENYKYLIDGSKGRSKGKSTGVPNNVVKLAFSNIQRNTTGVGNKSGQLRRLTYKEVLDGIGGFVDTDGKAKVKMGINAKSPEGQTFIGVMRTLNRMVSNELSRSAAVGLDPMTVKDIAAGKNVLMESKKLDVSMITRLTPEMASKFNKWYDSQKNPSSIKQLRFLTEQGKQILGFTGNRLFKAELAHQFGKLKSDATLQQVRDSLGKAWGKAYKWVYRDQGFNKALDKLGELSTKEDVRQFLQAYSRAWRNDNYQTVSTNEQMVKLLKDQGVDFEGLGFELEKRGDKGYVYETIDGKRDFVNNPTTLLEIKNKAFDRIEAYGLDSIKEVQKLQKVVLDVIDTALTVDDAIAAIEAMSIGQMGTLRRISYLRNVYKSDGPLVLEHVTSLAVIKDTLKEYARGNVKDIQGFLDGLYLDVIPKEIDDLLAKVGDEARYTPKIKALLKKYKLKSFDVVSERNSLKESKRAEDVRLATNLAMDRKSDAKRKGISVLDFDDTLARTASQVLYTLPNGKKGKLTAEQFAKDGDRMTKEGVEWDFSEFSKVVDGKKGPLFEKTKKLVSKFGNENVFILTARPANSKYAIHEFLSGLGLDIPLQNITGLADSNPQAKGDWITSKAAEGYNDFFFADDHIKNVMAVKEALNIDGVKSKVEQAIVKESKSQGQPKYIKDLLDVFDMDGEGQTLLDKATKQLDLQWNDLYSEVTGVDPDIEFNEVEAQKLGDQVSKGFRSRLKSIMRGYLVESGADDFLGLLYRTLPKGKQGEAMMRLYEENLLKPFAIASREIEKARIKMAKRYRDIKVNNGISDKVLNGKVTLKTESGKDITYTSEDAVRVYMWRKQGIEVPGLSEQNELDLAEHVKQSDELYRFTLNLMAKTLPEEFADPSKNWVTGSLKTDYLEGINKAKRKEALRFWSKGIETIFSESNMNKLRVQHGTKYVAALQNSIERMKTGRNSSQSLDSDTKVMLQFISGAVGNIMFLNTRSAGLQLLSATNFMNAGDNTWGKSLKTMFTKLPTLAKDYKMLMNTDFLLDRRNALKMDVNDSDIARIAEGKGLQGKLARFLQWGYVFTQAADSRAIALGGAVYYRNAYDKLIKQGVDPKAAKEQALLETTEHAQNSQQSSRADKISKQQASTSGRLMLAFANTPMQYNRLVQKAYLDLVNGRGNKGKNLYNIAYYGLAQNLLFTVAQGAMLTAVYGTLFGDDEEEDKLDYNKKVGIANGVLSSWLRGMGIWGNGLNALKQTFMNIHKESKKKRPEYDVAAIKGLTSIMPAVGSKISKIYATTKAIDYNKDFLFDVNEGNVFKNYAKMPGVVALGQTAALFNIPLDRAQRKLANLIDAVNYAQSDLTKTGGLLFGHSLWTLQSEAEKEASYEEQKARRKLIKKEKKLEEETKDLNPTELRRYDLKALRKQEQIDILFNKYKLSKKQINKLTKEEDRINKIMSLEALEKSKKRKDSLK